MGMRESIGKEKKLAIEGQEVSSTFIRLIESRLNNLEGDLSLGDYLSWDLKKLPLLTQLLDCEKASLRIVKAIENEELIGIYGDYDVDGTTSCALFYHFFQMLGANIKTYQPSRFTEGYGLHLHSIDKAIEDDVKLLITVDCGITNIDAAEYSDHRGLDLIITDHHKDGAERIPPAYAVVNPNRRDETCETDLRHLAGVGVAFAICMKVRELLIAQGDTIPTLYSLLPFVAIGTICDMAKLNPMNAKLVRHGLKAMKTSNYPGLKVFLDKDDREAPFISSEKCSFLIGPMINSKGRLDHPEKALELLVSKDADQALECFRHLEISNTERKFVQNSVFKEAKDQVVKGIDGSEMLINIIYQSEWHEGVIGIVASKLVENFKVPAIVFTDSEDEDIIKASCRSAGELNIYDELKKCEDLFVKFGGHKAAAGLSMPKENLKEFKRRMNESLKSIASIERTVQDFYDLELDFDEITPQFVKELEFLEPFGMGNQKPVFKLRNVKIDSYQILKDVHVKWSLKHEGSKRTLRGISFYYLDKWKAIHPEELFNLQDQSPLELTFTLSVNRFKGNAYIQLMLEDIRY